MLVRAAVVDLHLGDEDLTRLNSALSQRIEYADEYINRLDVPTRELRAV